VREGKPQDLKSSVGVPTLIIDVSKEQLEVAKTVLKTFGDIRPSGENSIGVGLRDGASAVTDVVRKLDESGVRVAHLELSEPSLDDVFAEATGHRLEGENQ
ncbi:MAG: DUF4162 domain-containing protein, partial [Ilumatobacteraceae bacterium]